MQKIATVFETDAGVEIPAVTAEQMREVDRIATEESGPTPEQMMENAGRSLASLALELLASRWCQAEVLVLAGPGGNGGGGLCAARHLANRGVDVRVCLSDPNELTDVVSLQRRILRSTGAREMPFPEARATRPAMILDALIGYGLKGSPRPPVDEMIRWANGLDVSILSLDLPSGLDAAAGGAPGEVIKPSWTMTLALPKRALVKERTGELYLADIGIPQAVYQKIGVSYHHPFDQRFIVPIHPREEG